MAKWVYSFGNGKAEGSASECNLLGGKGANLAEMSNLGLPVPPGFTLTTEVCSFYYTHDGTYPEELQGDVRQALQRIGEQTGREF
ncbi:MAG: PEP/pyruvate-binding domain-containing protein, partial [Bartonella sp.]|nr:PEP/pyruvate-binding domain-containing protein [Bartonella sp.]